MVLGLARALGPGEPHVGERLPHAHDDPFPPGFGKIVTGIRRYVGLARAHEDLVVLELRGLGVHRLRRRRERAPGAGERGGGLLRDDRLGGGDRFEQGRVGTGIEKAREQRVIPGPGPILFGARRMEPQRNARRTGGLLYARPALGVTTWAHRGWSLPVCFPSCRRRG